MAKPDHRLRVYGSIVDLIANPENPTPMVKLNRINSNNDFPIYVKLERYNPFGSVKDRIAYEMLKGLKVKDRTVIEPSSGNTGIALACIANAKGIPIEVAVPERIPDEKKTILRFSGVKVREADDKLCPLFPNEGARGLVKAMIESPDTKDIYVSPNQYENELNVMAHYKTTGPEIWEQTRGKITHFFAGLGTCGTITGVGKYIKEKNPEVKIIGVEPASPDHKLPGMKRITGLDEEFIPKILDRSVIDEFVAVSDEDAYNTAMELVKKDGIPVGPTTGAILYPALQAKTNTGLAVVISPDDAFKYASFYKDFLGEEPEEVKKSWYDLSGLTCPIPQQKTREIIKGLAEGETVEIALDIKSVREVIQEWRTEVKISPKRDGDKFILTITK